jgi:hypothetical protein
VLRPVLGYAQQPMSDPVLLSASEAREMPLDELALCLLRHLREEEEGGRTINRHSLVGTAALNEFAEGDLNG